MPGDFQVLPGALQIGHTVCLFRKMFRQQELVFPSYCVRNPILTKSECCVNEDITWQIFWQMLNRQDELLKTMIASVRNTEASLGMSFNLSF